MEKEIPYFSQPDNTHCFQACLKMALKYFFPEKDYSWEDLDKFSDKPKDKWTWICAAFVELKKMGLSVKVYTNFDYESFVKEGVSYLRKVFSKEVAEKNIEMSDIDSEVENAKNMIKEDIYEKREITFEDIEKWFKENYLIILIVNSMILNGKPGYSGHFVILTGIEENNILIHDPSTYYGSPNRKINKDIFLNALFYPEKEKEVYLIKK